MAEEPVQYSCAVLTISTGCAEGTREDRSGPAAQAILREAGFRVAAGAVVPDDVFAISEILTRWADVETIPLIVTSGGTGLTPNDVTPEATRALLHREVPGIAEAMRSRTLAATPMAMISRGLAGVRGRTLIINLPGSPKGVRECLEVVLPVLHHAIALIRQDPTSH
ncbi:MAG TPA: MogA/MoaB family molybdenum cofactor biosynthesis protein [Chloroflexota bacterium]|nr:MogA/MoaB family molybdenum cofactor biosynthesis protein [Chloroflexota bacterium]